MTTFTDYLKSIHGKQYPHPKDIMPEDFSEWLESRYASTIIEYAEKYAVLTRRELREEIEKLKREKIEYSGGDECDRCMSDYVLNSVLTLLKKLEGK